MTTTQVKKGVWWTSEPGSLMSEEMFSAEVRHLAVWISRVCVGSRIWPGWTHTFTFSTRPKPRLERGRWSIIVLLFGCELTLRREYGRRIHCAV